MSTTPPAVSRQRASLSDAALRSAGDLVRKFGMRRTQHRLAIVATLAELARPLTIGEIARTLTGIEIDDSTVWRNMVRLVEVGLVQRVLLPDEVTRFELCVPHGPHAHFVCTSCREVFCLRSYAPAGIVHERVGSVADVVVSGECVSCLEARNAEEPA